MMEGQTTTSRNPSWSFFTIGQASNPSSVRCRHDNVPFESCASSWVGTTPLPDGSHFFRVEAVDDAGNVGFAQRNFVVDATPPTVAITTGPADGLVTNNPYPSWAFTSGNGAVSTQCRIDSAAFAPCTGSYTQPPGSPLPNGVRTFTVRALDAAGNQATASRTITVDTIAPTATILTGPREGDTYNWYYPSWTFSTAGNPTTVECRVDSAPFMPCTTSYVQPDNAPLQSAFHTFSIRLTDAARNVQTQTVTFRVYIVG